MIKTNSSLSFELLNNEELSQSLKYAFLSNTKYYFILIGFGVGSIISLLTMLIEDISVGAPLFSAVIDVANIHHITAPILLGIVGIFAGIVYDNYSSEHKKVYNAFYESQQTLKLITDNLPSLVSYLDSDLNYLFANKMYSKWFKISPFEIFGKPVSEILNEETFNEIQPYFNKALEGQIVSFSRAAVAPHKKHFLKTTLVPHFDKNSSVVGIFSLTTDITKLKKKEKRIKKQKEELERINGTKDKLFSVIAHDLKSPFNSIIGLTQLLSEEVESFNKEEIIDIAKLLNIQSKDSFNLLNNLLDWARTQLKGINPSPEEFNLANIADEIIEMNKLKATQKKVILEKEVDASLSVFADKNLIHSVLQNLITNSVKFTPENGKVKLQAIQSNGEVTISVTDTGVGMTSDQIRSLFGQNVENHSTAGTNNEQGTGLGLIICKDFVEKNGGRLSVISEKGVGSTFSFNLPGSSN